MIAENINNNELPIDSIKPNSDNAIIYGNIDFSSPDDIDLLESIRQHGILNPILISKDNVIISGHRRYYSALKLKFETVPIIESDLSESDNQIALIESNRQRVKTQAQINKEIEYLTNVLSAKEKSLLNLKQYNNSNNTEMANSPKPINTRQEIAKTVGISERTVGTIQKVNKAIKEIEKDDPDNAKEIQKQLDKNANAGETALKKYSTNQTKTDKKFYEIVEQDGIYIATIINPDYKSGLTKQDNNSIQWASYSWNPVTGCKFNCSYCYAKQMTNRNSNIYPNGFEPTFYPHKLNIPSKTKHDDKLPNNRVFVCSMADLFGDWIPDKYIQQVIDVCKTETQFTYMFLTKNPDRYLSFEFSDNCYLGATATNQMQYDKAVNVFKQLKHKQIVNPLYISCEPFKEKINCYDGLNYVDLMIIGGESRGSYIPMDLQPKWEWVNDIIIACNKYDCRYWLKSNLIVKPSNELLNISSGKIAIPESKSDNKPIQSNPYSDGANSSDDNSINSESITCSPEAIEQTVIIAGANTEVDNSASQSEADTQPISEPEVITNDSTLLNYGIVKPDDFDNWKLKDKKQFTIQLYKKLLANNVDNKGIVQVLVNTGINPKADLNNVRVYKSQNKKLLEVGNEQVKI